jgi:hypothetical protein
MRKSGILVELTDVVFIVSMQSKTALQGKQ